MSLVEQICETHTFMIVEVCISHMGSTKDHELPEPFPKTPEAVESADWHERDAEVPETFDDGGFIVDFNYAGGKYEPLSGGLYYVPPVAGEADDGTETWQDWYEIRGSYRRNSRYRRAVLLGRLNAETGFWTEASGTGVPVSVAVAGQKAIAAYLFANKDFDVGTIAKKMEKADNTVSQYLSDYKAGR